MQWNIVDGPIPQPRVSDSECFLFIVERGSARIGVTVELSGTLMASAAESLSSPLDAAVLTKGRSVVEAYATEASMPRVVRVTSGGIGSLEPA